MHWSGKAMPVVLLLGLGIGSCTATDSSSGDEDTTIVKTKYVDKPVEKVVKVDKVSIPKECATALDLAASVKKDATKMVGVNTKTLDALAAGHQALTEGDGTEVNNQRDKLYKLEVGVNKVAQDLSLHDIPKLDEALSACKATKAY